MRSLLEKDGEILMHMLHAVVLNEGDRTVTSLAISPPILSIPVSLHEARGKGICEPEEVCRCARVLLDDKSGAGPALEYYCIHCLPFSPIGTVFNNLVYVPYCARCC